MQARNGCFLSLILALALIATAIAGCTKPAADNPQPPAETAVARPQWGVAWIGDTAIQMIDAKIGWAITRNGIARTTDGGLSWSAVNLRMPPGSGGIDSGYGQACFLGPDTAFLARTEGENARAVNLYRTSDGGVKWTKTSIATWPNDIPTPRAIGFADETHGWLLVNFGGVAMGSEMVGIYTTSDGGVSWQTATVTEPGSQQPNALPLGGTKSGVTFMNDKAGWVAGGWHGDGVWLYLTLDGGRTWQRAGLPVPKGYSTEGGAVRTMAPMFFGTKGIIPAVFSPERSIILFTTPDGGASWKATTPVPSGPDSNDFAWSFIDAAHGWLSDGQRIFSTADGGVAWTEIKADQHLGQLVQSGFRVIELNFIDARTGWALLQSGSGNGTLALLRTADGGATWADCTDPAGK